jgi:transaldolase
MTRLGQLYDSCGQSPWLDDLPRSYLIDGTLIRFIEQGIRGVTANPTILAKAIEGSDAYDKQFSELIAAKIRITDAYWDLVVDDAREALRLFDPLFDHSGGADGFVSIEVSPELAHDSGATIDAALGLHQLVRQPNLMVKIPATAEGIPAIRAVTAAGYNVNVTLIFSLARYRQVIDAYQAGLEEFVTGGGDPKSVHSVASFFVSRVDTEVDRRLALINTPQALSLRGKAAVAQAKLAYQLFRTRFSTSAWCSLEAGGARVQRPLWASTSTKNPSYPDTLYVDNLIGPDTVNTLPEKTIALFEDHGTVAKTLDQDVENAETTLDRLVDVGIDMEDVGVTLEEQGVLGFHNSFSHVLNTLDAKARRLARR